MDSTLYDRDYYQWLTETAYLLSEGRLSEMDVPNLLDEIEAIGKSQKRAISSYLRVLLLHLLKWQYQPQKRSGSWRSSIRNARIALAERLAESPSLKSYPETVLSQCYRAARANAADETGLPLATFPETPPFDLQDILSEEFLP
jgi:predicted DNA-binding ribbon-helix-helix protein